MYQCTPADPEGALTWDTRAFNHSILNPDREHHDAGSIERAVEREQPPRKRERHAAHESRFDVECPRGVFDRTRSARYAPQRHADAPRRAGVLTRTHRPLSPPRIGSGHDATRRGNKVWPIFHNVTRTRQNSPSTLHKVVAHWSQCDANREQRYAYLPLRNADLPPLAAKCSRAQRRQGTTRR